MAAKKILVFKGSPRKRGNSATLAEELVRGARAKGAAVECFYLHGMDIRPCTACDACQKNTALNCVIDDDMVGLYPKVRAADALVIASPIYWFTLSAQTKLFIDRLYALGGPQGYALAGRKLGVILTYADEDVFRSGAVNALRTLQDACAFIGMTVAGTVYGTAGAAGEIRRNRSLMKRARKLGEQLASAA